MAEERTKLIHGNCLEEMAKMEENSIDAIVTDPPYGIKFMGSHWDNGVPGVPFWEQALRVLKPGGHLLAFGGTRTYHRLVCAVEDAGFEVRDQIDYYYDGEADKKDFFDNLSEEQQELFLQAFGRPSVINWVYGSGMPKSHNVGKAVDRLQGNEREVVGKKQNTYDGAVRNPKNHKSPAELSNIGKWGLNKTPHGMEETKGDSEWEGWGTALKTAHEPIVVARKPLSEKTVAKNVLKWGTGAINVDGCRIPINPDVDDKRLGGNGSWKTDKAAKNIYQGGYEGRKIESSAQGRFPANLIWSRMEDEYAMKENLSDKQKKKATSWLYNNI